MRSEKNWSVCRGSCIIYLKNCDLFGEQKDALKFSEKLDALDRNEQLFLKLRPLAASVD